jgi:hypothetical protein
MGLSITNSRIKLDLPGLHARYLNFVAGMGFSLVESWRHSGRVEWQFPAGKAVGRRDKYTDVPTEFKGLG